MAVPRRREVSSGRHPGPSRPWPVTPGLNLIGLAGERKRLAPRMWSTTQPSRCNMEEGHRRRSRSCPRTGLPARASISFVVSPRQGSRRPRRGQPGEAASGFSSTPDSSARSRAKPRPSRGRRRAVAGEETAFRGTAYTRPRCTNPARSGADLSAIRARKARGACARPIEP